MPAKLENLLVQCEAGVAGILIQLFTLEDALSKSMNLERYIYGFCCRSKTDRECSKQQGFWRFMLIRGPVAVEAVLVRELPAAKRLCVEF